MRKKELFTEMVKLLFWYDFFFFLVLNIWFNSQILAQPLFELFVWFAIFKIPKQMIAREETKVGH